MRFFKTKGFFGECGYECNFTLNFEVGKKKFHLKRLQRANVDLQEREWTIR